MDDQHLRKIYERYSGPLLRFILRFTGERQIAEDVLHDVFTELINNKYLHSHDDGLKSWLFTVAKNKSLNCARARAREVVVAQVPETSNSEDEHDRNVLMEKLNGLELRLAPDLRETWQLRKAGLDYQQIAAQLSIPVGTVKSRFHRLVLFLREEFEK